MRFWENGDEVREQELARHHGLMASGANSADRLVGGTFPRRHLKGHCSLWLVGSGKCKLRGQRVTTPMES
jgi:hypothetical protein